MAILSNGKFYGFLCSVKETGRKLANGVKEYVEDFVSGFSGHGWKLWEYATGKWKLEIDTIVVRETMLIFEMLISKIRAIIGSQAITQGHGKVKSARISDDGTEYLIVLEDEDISIEAHDFVRCKEGVGSKAKSYHVEISSVNIETKTLHVPLSEFESDESGNVLNPPASGDELVQFGNSQNKARQSAIYMHADETGQPAIDVMFDLDSKNWDGKVKVRVGGEIPGTNGLRGFYCVNGLIKGVDDKGVVVYEFAPDGTVNIGRGNIRYNPTTNKVTLGSGVTLTWDNLDDETKENLKGEKGDKGDKGDQGLQGLQGEKGETGIAGDTGADGRTSYFHIKYSAVSNPTSSDQISETPNVYIGTYVDYTQADSTEPSRYVWARFQGIQGNHGEQGIPGINGEDGTTYYLHIKYSDDGGQTFTADNGEASGAWIGVCTNTDINDPTNVEAYKWSKIKGDTGPQGVPGEPGKDGKVYYTWIRYADSADGSGISNNPTGKKYMGLAYNRETSVESNTPGDYTWSLFRGEDGHDGVQGPAGADGKTTYTWIAYSDYSDGRDMYQTPNDNTKYIGIAINKEASVESNVPSDYTWSKFRGEDGEDANLLPWIESWNGYATELGEDYIVTPKMFSGIRNTDGTLTGVAQGKDCITIGGEKHSGLFGLKDGNIIFSIDDTGDVKTTGDVIAKAIKTTGMNVNDNFIINEKGEVSLTGKFSSSANGRRFEINPDNQTLTFYESSGQKGVEIYSNDKGLGTAQFYGEKGENPRNRRVLTVGGDGISFYSPDDLKTAFLDLYPHGLRIANTDGSVFGVFNKSSNGSPSVPIIEIYSYSWPTSSSQVQSGGVYVENGFLKVKPW